MLEQSTIFPWRKRLWKHLLGNYSLTIYQTTMSNTMVAFYLLQVESASGPISQSNYSDCFEFGDYDVDDFPPFLLLLILLSVGAIL